MAKLFVSVIGADGKSEVATSEATLNLLPVSQSRVLMNQGNNNGAAVGMAFMAGQYENQVQICVEKTPDGNEISSEHPVTLRIGFSVADGATVTDNDLTAVDIGISAQVFINMYAGTNRASVDIIPNFNSRRLTLRGTLMPIKKSSVYQGWGI